MTRSIGAPMALLVLLLGTTAIYWQNTLEIVEEWSGNGPYSHGFLALAIVCWLIWEDRHRLTASQPVWWILPVLVGGGCVWWLAGLVSVQMIQLLAVLGMFYCAVLFVLGWRTVLELRYPLLCLLLILPIWNFLQIPLQEMSSDATEVLLRVIGIPLYREGFHFSVPGGRFVVEEACSGLGFLLTSVLLAVLFIQYHQLRGKSQLAFILFAMVLAVISNWIRIGIIMVVGNYTRMDHFIVQDHLTFGWIVFTITLVPFFVVGHYLQRRSEPDNRQQSDASSDTESSVSARRLVPPVIALAVFPLVGLVHDAVLTRVPSANPVAEAVRQVLPDMSRKITWNPVFIGADDIDHWSTTGGESIGPVGVMVVQYRYQRQGEELIFVNNHLFDEHHWQKQSEQTVTTPEGRVIRLLTLRGNGGQERTIAYWYVINNQATSNQVSAKLLGLLGAVKGDRSAYLVALAQDASRVRTETTQEVLFGLVDRVLAQSAP